jgi:hypothetical protein
MMVDLPAGLTLSLIIGGMVFVYLLYRIWNSNTQVEINEALFWLFLLFWLNKDDRRNDE